MSAWPSDVGPSAAAITGGREREAGGKANQRRKFMNNVELAVTEGTERSMLLDTHSLQLTHKTKNIII